MRVLGFWGFRVGAFWCSTTAWRARAFGSSIPSTPGVAGQGSGFRISGCRVQGLGSIAQDVGVKVIGLRGRRLGLESTKGQGFRNRGLSNYKVQI
jgi:hypothetical protein